MKKFIITLVVVVFAACAFAKEPVKNVKQDAAKISISAKSLAKFGKYQSQITDELLQQLNINYGWMTSCGTVYHYSSPIELPDDFVDFVMAYLEDQDCPHYTTYFV
jgi:hypothetical protein